MSLLGRINKDQLRSSILDAVVRCSERCLYQSAKWYFCSDLPSYTVAVLTDSRAAELANSLPPESNNQSFETDTDSSMHDADPAIAPNPIISSNPDPEEARLEALELPQYLLAKTFFDCREFARCAAVFLGPTTGSLPSESPKGKARSGLPSGFSPSNNGLPALSQRSLFLALYAKYMAGEKLKDEESEMILGPADVGVNTNKELVGLSKLLEGWFADRTAKGLEGSNQGWLEYLYGMVLRGGKTHSESKRWLIKSIHLAPFNWGAWTELCELLSSKEELPKILKELPQNVMSLVFHIYARQELYQSSRTDHKSLSEVQKIFPGSEFLQTQRALLYYHAKEFDEAESEFSKLLTNSPHRLDSLDHYSNALYVMANRPKLAFLAQVATATDKFRPETCCVVGNYYSLKSEHEKAIMYFRRALTLDRNSLSAWTLMGHEYVELKNTHAAIESYRRAVDVNRKDYRAWYSLGQAYEVLEMHFYALFYFQRASSLRPQDPKMWQAIGQCYDKIGRPIQSIKVYKRALTAGTHYENSTSSFGSDSTTEPPSGVLNPEILYQIALMYEKLNQTTEAASYMELTVAQEEGPMAEDGEGRLNEDPRVGGTGVTMTTSRARMWLARWESARGHLTKSMDLANELCQDGAEVEEAKALLRDLSARMEAESSSRGTP